MQEQIPELSDRGCDEGWDYEIKDWKPLLIEHKWPCERKRCDNIAQVRVTVGRVHERFGEDYDLCLECQDDAVEIHFQLIKG